MTTTMTTTRGCGCNTGGGCGCKAAVFSPGTDVATACSRCDEAGFVSLAKVKL